MITFNVGPSKVYPELEIFLQNAYNEGILSMAHRGVAFGEMMKKTLALLSQKLNIPPNYTIVFASSATECWEIIPQSLTQERTYHIFNGAFGEKWWKYASNIHLKTEKIALDISEILNLEKVQTFLTFTERRGGKIQVLDEHELICLTHNETSNGSKIPNKTIEDVFNNYPKQLIAYDCTSSMAGVALPWNFGDVWYASVQKCFGLPAGLAIMVLSPRAIARMKERNDRKHYNSLLPMYENIQKYQTTHTPNVLGIYLLMRVLEKLPNIVETEQMVQTRAKAYYNAVIANKRLELLVSHQEMRSDTVIAIKTTPENLTEMKYITKKEGIEIGNGYDIWKENTFRIANFPALDVEEVEKMTRILQFF
jgi:phosphoserine aminotransferase